jgi:hypothetical protein
MSRCDIHTVVNPSYSIFLFFVYLRRRCPICTPHLAQLRDAGDRPLGTTRPDIKFFTMFAHQSGPRNVFLF